MADRPILFSAPMVRALIYEAQKPGTGKTQTRRMLKTRLDVCASEHLELRGFEADEQSDGQYLIYRLPCFSGDLLWVREAWRTFVSLDHTRPSDLYRPGERGAGVLFEADNGGLAITPAGDVTIGYRDDQSAFGKLRTPLFMPRWASRLTLRVTGVKVERLQDTSHEDALAEGASLYPLSMSAQKGFLEIWTSLHGPDAWAANPWVAAITFRPVLANIDAQPLAPADPLAIGAAT